VTGDRYEDDEDGDEVGGHEVGAIDLSQLEEAGFASVIARVQMAQVRYQLEGTSLIVGAADLDATRELVTETIALSIARPHEVPIEADDDVDERSGKRFDPDAPFVIASGWRRLVGYVAEGFILGIVVLVYRVLTHTIAIEGAAGLVVPVLNGVVAVAVFGRTVGMFVTGTRVIMATTGNPPGWATAVIRWVVALGPGLLPFVLDVTGIDVADTAWRWLSIVGLVWTIAVYLPIAYDDRRRGLHDRVAGTEVVLSRRR
jgi:uncharacterized RDD family membrane protein YckC